MAIRVASRSENETMNQIAIAISEVVISDTKRERKTFCGIESREDHSDNKAYCYRDISDERYDILRIGVSFLWQNIRGLCSRLHLAYLISILPAARHFDYGS